MTKKQKKVIDNLLKRKKAFDRFVKRTLEKHEAEGIYILAIVSNNGEFEWRR